MGARISKNLREEIARDLVMCHFLQRFLACRSHESLGLEFGLSHVAIRKIESGQTKNPSLLPEQVESLMLARKQYNLLAPLKSRYTKNGIAKHHGVSFHAVSRVERDFFQNRNGVRRYVSA